MFLPMRDFLIDDTYDETARSIFIDAFNADKSDFDELVVELRHLVSQWDKPLHIKPTHIIFATLVPSLNHEFPSYPLSDLSKISISDIDLIPEYIKQHDFTDSIQHIDKKDFLRFVRPPILDTTSDFFTYLAYIIDDEPYYRPALLSAILYELSLLGSSLEISDRRKEEITSELLNIKEEKGFDASIEELFVESGLNVEQVCSMNNENLDCFYLSRYNARIATYERLHFDATSASTAAM